MAVERVENGNGPSLAIDRIELGRLPEGSDLETHGWTGRKKCLSKGRV